MCRSTIRVLYTRIGLALVAALLFSCHPKVGVRVFADKDGYIVEFRSCNDFHLVSIRSVKIVEAAAGREKPMCELTEHPSWESESFVRATWRYGTPWAGFQVSGCQPLKKGTRYKVTASMTGHAVGEFSVSPTGAIKMHSGECD